MIFSHKETISPVTHPELLYVDGNGWVFPPQMGVRNGWKTLTFIPLPYLTDHTDQMQEIPRETHSQGLTAQIRRKPDWWWVISWTIDRSRLTNTLIDRRCVSLETVSSHLALAPVVFGMATTQEICQLLGLQPHPEGGFFAETFKDTDINLPHSVLPATCKHMRLWVAFGGFAALIASA